MPVPEIARRLIGNVWVTSVADDGGGGNGGSQPASVVTVLDADDIYALDGSPQHEIAPAPDADQMILPSAILYHFTPGAAAFFMAGELHLEWTWGDDDADTLSSTQTALSITGAERIGVQFGAVLEDFGGDVTAFAGLPLKFAGGGTGVPVIPGALTVASLVDGGSGYANGDTGNIVGSGGSPGSGATYIVTSVSAGVITALTITAGGSNYIAGGAYALVAAGAQPGAGENGFVDGTTTSESGAPGDGTLTIEVSYQLLDL